MILPNDVEMSPLLFTKRETPEVATNSETVASAGTGTFTEVKTENCDRD